MHRHRHERHRLSQVNWLRAGVLGANDGIVSTASLILGVAASSATRAAVLLSGLAGLVAGAMSMAVGEYVSVHSQADAEKAALDQERDELASDYVGERHELAAIYVARGVAQPVARQVAEQLMAHDALAAHARDELGLTEALSAKPLQAAVASAASFTSGAAVPLLIAALVPHAALMASTVTASLLCLLVLGAASARIASAPMIPGAARVVLWSALAMAVTAAVGAIAGRA